MTVLPASRFGLLPDTGEDMTVALAAALAACSQWEGVSLVLEAGRYDFSPDRAFEKYLFISNNDEGLKRIGFPLIRNVGLSIEGNGARFVFQGPMIPFLIEESRGIAVRNLSLDFSRSFHSEALVLAVRPDSLDLAISDEFPFVIRNGVLVFTGRKVAGGLATTVKGGEVLYPYGSLLAFDATRRETAFMAWDKYHVEQGIPAEEIAPGRVRIFLSKVSAEPGNILVFGAGRRDWPGFVISDSEDVRLENVTVFHCGGMGVIAQRSADIFLDHVRMTPPGPHRMISCSADATHFTNCRGRIELTDCLFENQMDDASNFHGLYALVTRIVGPRQFEARLVHPQQAGVVFVKPGTRLELTKANSLQEFAEIVVEAVTSINKEYFLVTTQEALPGALEEGDVIANADANTADVLIRRCVIRNNRARGLLLGSRGNIVIEENLFHTPGAAILFEGDACHWFEQAGVRDVTIRGNIFDNCNFGVWGDAAIEVKSGISRGARKTSRYNRRIVIEGNLFRTFGGNQVVNVYSVEGLVFRGNRLETTSAYPRARTVDSEIVCVTDSSSVVVEEFLPASVVTPSPHLQPAGKEPARVKKNLTIAGPAGK